MFNLNALTSRSIRNASYTISVVVHLLLLLLFLFLTYNITYSPKEYVELSFGTSGQPGSSGAVGTSIQKIQETSTPEIKSKTVETKREVKEVELPQAKNTSEDNIITPADKTKEKAQEVKTQNENVSTAANTSVGQGNKAEGDGSFGFDIDWGGKGKRKIYSYNLPDYPAGVYKEIDIRLRFTILPDGTVGTIHLLTKADSKLENSAINSLRNWRFEELSPNQRQGEQTAVIVFPYRLQ
jgi:membrane protein involved in colicin uptake